MCVDASNVGALSLSLIWALQHFEVYVGSVMVPLIVYTDHNPLTYLHTLRSPNQRLTRWCLFLQSYALEIRHIKVTDNVVADELYDVFLPLNLIFWNLFLN